MKRALCAAAGLALLVLTGCQQGSSTAPSTDPSRPGAARKLTITSPGEQKITQDGTDELTVSIRRDNFTGPVDIELRDLPKGVTVVSKDLTIPGDKNSLTVALKAALDTATLDDHPVTVVAKAKDQKDLPEAVTTFKLDVKAKSK